MKVAHLHAWRRLLQGVFGAFFLMGCATLKAEDLYVVANPNVELSAEQVRDVFLGDKLIASGVKLVPVDNEASQAQFLARVMQLDASRYESIWIKKGFREGLAAPSIKPGDVDVVAYVRRTPGAIGYVTRLNGLPASLGIKLVTRL